jgi:hypothetical protein
VFPDILVVPLLASIAEDTDRLWGGLLRDAARSRHEAGDRHRHRLAAQEIDMVPTTPRDARLDLVLTERGSST